MDIESRLNGTALPVGGAELKDLADLLIANKMMKEEAEARLAEANAAIRKVEGLMIEKMAADEIEKFAHAGNLFYPYESAYPRAAAGREEEYFAWLEEHGEDGIVRRTVHPQTHRSWWKQHEEYHEELTEKGLVDAHVEIRIGMRKSK